MFYSTQTNSNMLTDLTENYTDPGGYPTGNYKGILNQNGVQGVWTQQDFGSFQLQVMVRNGVIGWNYRIKYVGEDWASKPWISI